MCWEGHELAKVWVKGKVTGLPGGEEHSALKDVCFTLEVRAVAGSCVRSAEAAEQKV